MVPWGHAQLEGSGRESQESHRDLPPLSHGGQVEVLEKGGRERDGEVLHELVAHAGALARGEGFEVDGPAEDHLAGVGALAQEAAGVVAVRVRAPQLLGEVRVVVVDEDDSALLDLFAWN